MTNLPARREFSKKINIDVYYIDRLINYIKRYKKEPTKGLSFDVYQKYLAVYPDGSIEDFMYRCGETISVASQVGCGTIDELVKLTKELNIRLKSMERERQKIDDVLKNHRHYLSNIDKALCRLSHGYACGYRSLDEELK